MRVGTSGSISDCSNFLWPNYRVWRGGGAAPGARGRASRPIETEMGYNIISPILQVDYNHNGIVINYFYEEDGLSVMRI